MPEAHSHPCPCSYPGPCKVHGTSGAPGTAQNCRAFALLHNSAMVRHFICRSLRQAIAGRYFCFVCFCTVYLICSVPRRPPETSRGQSEKGRCLEDKLVSIGATTRTSHHSRLIASHRQGAGRWHLLLMIARILVSGNRKGGKVKKCFRTRISRMACWRSTRHSKRACNTLTDHAGLGAQASAKRRRA